MNKHQIDIITWVLFIASFVGAVYNIKKKTVGFVIWGIADLLFTIMYVIIGEYASACLFAMYTGINAYGTYEWSKK